MKKKRLNFKQKLFCDWYIKLGNGTQAAIKAGYSQKTAQEIASENLSKPMIQEYLAIRRHRLEELLGFNKATIIQDLLDIKDKCKQAKPVMTWDRKTREMVQVMEVNDVGEEVGVYEFDSLGAIKALENINKMMGYNEPEKVEDVTPLEKKPAAVIVNKTYVNQKPDQPAA